MQATRSSVAEVSRQTPLRVVAICKPHEPRARQGWMPRPPLRALKHVINRGLNFQASFRSMSAWTIIHANQARGGRRVLVKCPPFCTVCWTAWSADLGFLENAIRLLVATWLAPVARPRSARPLPMPTTSRPMTRPGRHDGYRRRCLPWIGGIDGPGSEPPSPVIAMLPGEYALASRV